MYVKILLIANDCANDCCGKKIKNLTFFNFYLMFINIDKMIKFTF